ncbi:MAG: NAD(P)/FAD-dependent oxidoreductase [Pyrinomonadaceae bacterium]|nr:NAD(P)/FAD-dependent oxidoreductase [Pyrinomonadaceae bacterium]
MKPDFQVGIVGAGFAGIIAALRLQKSKRDSFVIFERAQEVGGTWRDNIYPGCACDVPSNLYSISFEPNPNWKQMYSPQAEILEYLKTVVRKNNIESRIRYDSDIVRFEFVEKYGWWKLTDRRDETTIVRTVILAVGPFNRPQLPDIRGIETFQGKTLHSARWESNYDLKGKRVAVVGTGASAVQIVPAIASDVSHLTIFQRTAAWISERMDADVPLTKQRRYQKLPLLQSLKRGLLYWFLEFRGLLFTGNERINRFFHKLSLQKLEREVDNPETRRKLTPDYKLGCKRILSSDDYLPTFNRENVNLETDRIAEITPEGILTAAGTLHKLDTIIFATGFEVADFTTDAQLFGRNGRELFTEWREKGLEAYKGTTVSGYPNLAFILGPNTGLGHSSMIHVMESQMNYILKYLDLLEKKGENAFLDLKSEVQKSYNQKIHEQFQTTVWASGCNSWYLNRAGRNTTLYPRLTARFRRETEPI